ncbi:hypothetical protein FNF27_04124 [Cafeteria roenbergensis]|uniref:Intraflagellar transport protein 74 n=2 Tax=Cafeteria roenbergensis TaxID=33653 RepID=A0A5A8CE75_CAFRO|nr:hypothetical protein FNF29_04747 [Cafeteria roenbergensis]KAA0160177.1 hypothetical protein FNF31_04487 [Cafeteria roenbergensis]KAA0174332.1 hypothetical protein FNF27_04124 [Cafeteria roenbergensis]|eukprot:KAA0151272.1 hypothetical protein FNF29_04747 [Cafeteria roenbergensis]
MAARPGSGAGYGGMRPGTGQRLGTGMRTGTGRMGTAARLGTGQQPANFGGVGLNTAVAVADRPVTRQGMGGMRVKTAGPGRQVQDVSFFHGLLRKRVADLVAELGRMRTEMGERSKNKATQQTLSRRYEDLIGEVRGLEGTLADYNLAQDKARAGVDPVEIAAFGASLRRRNADESRAIDRIFLDRQDIERGVERLEAQTQEVRAAERARLDTLPAGQRAEFAALLERNEASSKKVDAARAELAKLNARISEHEAALQEDVYREECALLERKLELTNAAVEEAEAELAAGGSPDDSRARLLAKVRTDNERTKALTAALAEHTDERNRLTRLAAELDRDIAERERGGGQEAKYDELFRRDEEMTQFIDRYPEMRSKEEAEQARARETIVALLEHISGGLAREHSMPSQAEHKELSEELQDKEQELAASRYTEEHLQAELARRRGEFEKVTRIDSDVTAETSTLQERIRVMRAEMEVFEDVDRVRTAAEKTMAELEARRNAYKRRRDGARQQLRAMATEYQRKQSMLDSHEVEASLRRLEDKLRSKEAQVQAAKEFVAVKGRHTEFRNLRRRALELTEELNDRIKELASRVVPVAAAMG